MESIQFSVFTIMSSANNEFYLLSNLRAFYFFFLCDLFKLLFMFSSVVKLLDHVVILFFKFILYGIVLLSCLLFHHFNMFQFIDPHPHCLLGRKVRVCFSVLPYISCEPPEPSSKKGRERDRQTDIPHMFFEIQFLWSERSFPPLEF